MQLPDLFDDDYLQQIADMEIKFTQGTASAIISDITEEEDAMATYLSSLLTGEVDSDDNVVMEVRSSPY